MLAVPTELPLDGKTFMISPLSDRDSEELNEWVRAVYIRQARQSLTEEERDTPEGREFVRQAQNEALGLTWHRNPGSRLVFVSKMGIARLLLPGVRRNDRSVTVDDIVACIGTAEAVNIAEETFTRINDLRIIRKTEDAKGKEGPT